MTRIAGILPHSIASYRELNLLKQSFLLCDVVGFFSIDNQIASLRRHAFRYPGLGHIANELEYLFNEGYLIEALKADEAYNFSENDPVAPELLREIRIIQELDAKIGKTQYDILYRTEDSKLIEEAKARLSCIKLNHQVNNFTAVPLISQLKLPKDSNATKSDIIKLVMGKIPIPDDQTPWEKVIEFKNDTSNQGRLAVLKDWMNKAVSSNRPTSEISDELEALLFQYQTSLDIHKIKYKSGILQSLIVGTAELVENVARLRFSNVAKSLFSAQVAQAELYNTELSAPGNALAYIYKVNENFHIRS